MLASGTATRCSGISTCTPRTSCWMSSGSTSSTLPTSIGSIWSRGASRNSRGLLLRTTKGCWNNLTRNTRTQSSTLGASTGYSITTSATKYARSSRTCWPNSRRPGCRSRSSSPTTTLYPSFKDRSRGPSARRNCAPRSSLRGSATSPCSRR